MGGGSATEGGKAEQRFPWQLVVGALAWSALGVTSLAVALGGGRGGNEADAGSVSRIQGTLGESAAYVGERGGANAAILVLIGLAALLLTVLLVLGQGWARMALTVVGVVAVLYFATTVGWVPTVVAMLVLVVGSVLLLSGSVRRYLAG